MKYHYPQYVLTLNVISSWAPAIPAFISLLRFRKAGLSTKLMILLVVNGAACELLALYFTVRYKNNHIVYSVFDVFAFSLMCLYYNFCIPRFRKKHTGISMAVIGLFICLVNAFYIEPQNLLKLNFTMFASIITIILSYYSLYSIVIKNDDDKFRYNPDFWFASLLMVYNFSTFPYWAVHNIILRDYELRFDSVIQVTGISLAILYNFFFALIFLFLPKLRKKYEQ